MITNLAECEKNLLFLTHILGHILDFRQFLPVAEMGKIQAGRIMSQGRD